MGNPEQLKSILKILSYISSKTMTGNALLANHFEADSLGAAIDPNRRYTVVACDTDEGRAYSVMPQTDTPNPWRRKM